MYGAAILVFAAIAAIFAVVAVLPLFGFDLRIIGRPKVPSKRIEPRPARKAWFALLIVIVSLGLSAGAFYYFFRPRIVEKIVEKPVEKLVEKRVLQECPKLGCPKTAATPNLGTKVKSPAASSAPLSQECAPGGKCAQSSGQQGGITAAEINLGPPPIEIKFSTESVTSTRPEFPYQTNVIVFTSAEYSPVSLAIECDVVLAPDVTFDFGSHGSAMMNLMSGLTKESSMIAFVKFSGTAISDDNPLYVHLWSKEPLHVLKVVQARLKQSP